MRRTFLAFFILAVSAGCGVDSSRAPLSPSALGGGAATQQAGMSQVSWACLTGSEDCVGAVPSQHPVTGRADGLGPTNFNFTVSGTTVILTWSAPADNTPTEYQIEAGTGPGLSNIIVFRTGNNALGLVVSNVPTGTYYARIRGVSAANVATEVSNEIIVIVNPAACINGVSPTTVDVGSGATNVTLNVTSNCNWTATSNAAHITVTSATGAGNGTVVLAVAVNSGAARSGTVTVAGVIVTVNQAAGSLHVSFQLFDTAQQTSATTQCRVNSSPTTCQLRSNSFTFGANRIVTYAWTVTYTYGTVKTLTQSGESPIFTFTEVCGGSQSTPEGAVQPLSVTLIITDNLGATATATSGSGAQPALTIKLHTCS